MLIHMKKPNTGGFTDVLLMKINWLVITYDYCFERGVFYFFCFFFCFFFAVLMRLIPPLCVDTSNALFQNINSQIIPKSFCKVK